MQEIRVKTHLIITDIHDEYHMNWCGRIIDAKTLIKDGKHLFIIIGAGGRLELNTVDMNYIEQCAKLLTRPKGRSAVSTDTSRIYIREENGNDFLLGTMTHSNIKTFSQMTDKVGFER